jgi:ParB family transcriptional regulator, chromosome partitioning protein
VAQIGVVDPEANTDSYFESRFSNAANAVNQRKEKAMTTIAKHATAATKKSKPADHTIDRRHRDNADAADCMTGAKPSSITVVRVRIADIAIPEKSRSIRQDTVDALAASMKQIGLRTPISVRNSKKEIQLVAGRHRLEAAKTLGWKRIDAIVMRDDRLDRRIWHNAENLDRADLTALERAEAVTQRAKDVAKKAAQDAHPGGRQPHDKGVSKAAKAIRVSRDNIRRSRTIAGISSAAKKAANDAGLTDNEAALLKIAKEPTPDAQVLKVRDLTKPKRILKPHFSDKERKQYNRLKRTFAEATDHRHAWERAGKIARDRFIARICKLAPGV